MENDNLTEIQPNPLTILEVSWDRDIREDRGVHKIETYYTRVLKHIYWGFRWFLSMLARIIVFVIYPFEIKRL